MELICHSAFLLFHGYSRGHFSFPIYELLTWLFPLPPAKKPCEFFFLTFILVFSFSDVSRSVKFSVWFVFPSLFPFVIVSDFVLGFLSADCCCASGSLCYVWYVIILQACVLCAVKLVLSVLSACVWKQSSVKIDGLSLWEIFGNNLFPRLS